MNTARNTITLAAASLLLAACASTPGIAGNPGQGRSAQDVDAAYMEAVNRASRQAGVTVVWVNPPRPGDRKN